jgi:hypothetical protein
MALIASFRLSGLHCLYTTLSSTVQERNPTLYCMAEQKFLMIWFHTFDHVCLDFSVREGVINYSVMLVRELRQAILRAKEELILRHPSQPT